MLRGRGGIINYYIVYSSKRKKKKNKGTTTIDGVHMFVRYGSTWLFFLT